MKTSISIWQHGTAAVIEHPEKVLLFRRTGNAIRVVGAAGSTNWLHYPLPLHHYLTKGTFCPLQILLRYRCDSPTALITNIALYDAEKLVFRAAGLNLCASDWEDFTLVINQKTLVERSLNLSVGIRFDGADEDTHALELSGVGVLIKEEKNQNAPFELKNLEINLV